jgi:PBSX family phage terminase large subunit
VIAAPTNEIIYEPRGAARAVFTCKAPEVLLAGPAGTGKSRSALEKIHLLLLKYDGARALMCRKTLRSLTGTGLVTYREKIKPEIDGVTFFGGSAQEPPQFRYPNGARFLVGGLDNPTKTLSSEYDIVYVQEATELSENDWEFLTRSLRWGVVPYQQMLADCNADSPYHWLKQRVDRGATTMLDSRHEDNPLLWDGTTWTPFGTAYIARLDALTGVRKERLRYGRWAAAEGLVYDGFDRAIHLIDRFEIPASWRRIRSIDFGYSNPFVCAFWAIDPDGRMYLYREIYRSQRIVSDHAIQINALSAGERIEASVADHDAEDRATLRASGITTVPAQKQISVGIQKVQERLRVAGDGKPRIFILRDSLVERDDLLVEAKKPYATEQEIGSYVWPKGIDGKAVKEVPVDLDNHGMDAMRYAVMHVDGPRTFREEDIQAAAAAADRPNDLFS